MFVSFGNGNARNPKKYCRSTLCAEKAKQHESHTGIINIPNLGIAEINVPTLSCSPNIAFSDAVLLPDESNEEVDTSARRRKKTYEKQFENAILRWEYDGPLKLLQRAAD